MPRKASGSPDASGLGLRFAGLGVTPVRPVSLTQMQQRNGKVVTRERGWHFECQDEGVSAR